MKEAIIEVEVSSHGEEMPKVLPASGFQEGRTISLTLQHQDQIPLTEVPLPHYSGAHYSSLH